MKQTEVWSLLTHETKVNGVEPAVYMSCMSQNLPNSSFELIRSKLSFFSAHVTAVDINRPTAAAPRLAGDQTYDGTRPMTKAVTESKSYMHDKSMVTIHWSRGRRHQKQSVVVRTPEVGIRKLEGIIIYKAYGSLRGDICNGNAS